jgi:hypothetical protein
MATFDRVKVETSNYTDVAFLTNPDFNTVTHVTAGAVISGTSIGVKGIVTDDFYPPFTPNTRTGIGVHGVGLVNPAGESLTGEPVAAVGVFGEGSTGVIGRGLPWDGTGNADGVQGYGAGSYSGVAGFGDPEGNGTGVRGIGSNGPDTLPSGPVGVYGQGGLEHPGVVGQAGGVFANGVEGYGAGSLSGIAGFGDPGGDSTGVNGTGVYGQGSGPGGPGVRGIGSGGPATWPPGTAGVYGQGGPQNPGVYGQAGSGDADGVQGWGSGSWSGVAGFGDPGGDSTGVNGTGVYGQGSGPGGPGVRGIGSGGPDTWPPGTAGVYGQGGPQNPGVVGQAGSDVADGVQGYGTGAGSGVAGFGDESTNSAGVLGTGRGPSAPGVTGIGAAPSGIGGIFQGGQNAPPLPVNVPGPVGVFASAALPPGGSPAGEGIAVVGTSSNGGTAVLALSTADPNTGNSAPALVATADGVGTPGVLGTGQGPSAPGITGIGAAPSGIGGIFQGGENAPPLPVNVPGPVGVFASAALPPGGNASGEGIAVVGISSNGGTAVLAQSTADPTGNSAPALVAIAGGSGLAASFTGDVSVAGTLTATAKSFVIDHPLDPANRYLAHASVESWEHVNIYSGNVVLDDQGEAVVNLPTWVQALCEDFRYQLTCVGRPAPVYVADEVADNDFRIAGGPAGTKVSWQLTGIRKDAWAKAHPLVVEQDKPGE